ncbi:MAG: ferrous iron transport protein B [Promethearchaeota archaeon]
MSEQNVALIGNPNVGKTVIFNALTSSKAHVANWPGVTVEKKTGKLGDILITDLPGTYSLTPTALDDLIARNFIIEQTPKIVIDIIDATNLERNLYLGILLKEIGVPVIFVLNMMDIARQKKIDIDYEKLAEFLHSPVIPTAAIKNEGIEELKKFITKYIRNESVQNNPILYTEDLEKRIIKIQNSVEESGILKKSENSRWIAIKLMELDEKVTEKIKNDSNGQNLMNLISQNIYETDRISLASARYSFIKDVVNVCVKKTSKVFDSSEFLDQFFLNKYFGIPIFFVIMWEIFEFTFSVAAPLMTLVEVIQEMLGTIIINGLGETLFSSFLVDGLVNGFGTIIIFLPNIFLMFLGLSFLEDSGYLARAAFVMDRLMYKLGLHGRSFVSMLLGFGCNVPAIMSTRAIESEDDRIITIMVNQNMSCGARLPVYILIGGAIWKNSTGSIIFSLYFLGILLAILIALIFRKFVFKGKRSPFILELGDYRSPTIKSTFIHMWERGREFIKKAGTIIFFTILVMWILQTFPLGVEINESYLYKIGEFFHPIFKPLHFGVIAVIGLIFGFIAKEVVISSFGLLLGVGEESANLGQLIIQNLGNSPVIAYSYLVFVLLYIPCVATIGAIYKETGSKKWTIISVLYSLALAYLIAFLVQLIGGVYF